MPSNKKTPVTNIKKRTTASARSKISTKRVKKSVPNSDGSYIQDQPHTNVSTSDQCQPDPTSASAHNEAILSLLHRLDESNRALTTRMDRMEQRSFNSTPVTPRAHSHVRQPATTLPHTASERAPTGLDPPAVKGSDLVPQGQVHQTNSAPLLMTGTANTLSQAEPDRRDTILPNLDVLRQMPAVSETVTNLLSTYEQRGRQEVLQGKNLPPKKSGRYNSVDLVNVAPQLRWPNEGYHGSQGRKRLTYDDLSFPQWVSGQLTNVYNINDPALLRQALLQVIMATRDAASLPWPVVRNAWAVSMHQVEEGSLDWSQTTQWSLNRLSASQLAMTTINPTTHQKKPCKFYNEGSCSHEGNHGSYTHICNFCNRQGRVLSHPEAKCSFKAKTNKQNINPNS